MLLVFLALAFIVGLCLRHYNETQSFLPVDLLTKMRSKSEGDAAADKGGEDKKDASAKPAAPATPAAPAEKKAKEPAKPAGAGPEMNMNGEPKMNQ